MTPSKARIVQTPAARRSLIQLIRALGVKRDLTGLRWKPQTTNKTATKRKAKDSKPATRVSSSDIQFPLIIPRLIVKTKGRLPIIIQMNRIVR
jgi:hypothetical protein